MDSAMDPYQGTGDREQGASQQLQEEQACSLEEAQGPQNSDLGPWGSRCQGRSLVLWVVITEILTIAE